MSAYTPQVGEETSEMLTRNDRAALYQQMPHWQRMFPKLLMTQAMANAFVREHPGRAMHPGRRARLPAVWLRRQRRVPFAAPYHPGRTTEDWAPGYRFGRGGRDRRPLASVHPTGPVA